MSQCFSYYPKYSSTHSPTPTESDHCHRGFCDTDWYRCLDHSWPLGFYLRDQAKGSSPKSLRTKRSSFCPQAFFLVWCLFFFFFLWRGIVCFFPQDNFKLFRCHQLQTLLIQLCATSSDHVPEHPLWTTNYWQKIKSQLLVTNTEIKFWEYKEQNFNFQTVIMITTLCLHIKCYYKTTSLTYIMGKLSCYLQS